MNKQHSLFRFRILIPPPGLLFFILLCALPALLFLAPLRRGEIPYFMDTLMYFFPLRVQAARLLEGGDWPLWNRCLMGGVPLFENPQAALAYPAHWPFFAAPGGFWFTFPMLAHLGLWAALTFWAVRRIGARRGPAFFAGALALAGSYGWSRLQYGNYMNVLPWWPLWLGAAHAFAAAGGAFWLLAGGLAASLMLLAGAHQLAVYGMAGLGVYALAQVLLARGRRVRWLLFLLITFACGVAIAAPGWLPQLGFIKETSRPQGLSAREVLSGTIGSWAELVRALTCDWPSLKLAPAAPWSDAESSAALGLVAPVLAALMPRRRRLRRAWIGCWAAALLGIALSLRVVMAPLLEAWPRAGLFHDPRRWLGLTQWMLILAAPLGVSSFLDHAPFRNRREAQSGKPRPLRPAPPTIPILPLLARYLPPLVLLAALAAPQVAYAPRYTLAGVGLAVAVLILLPFARFSAARALLALAHAAVLALVAHATWVTTDLKTIPADAFNSPSQPPLIALAGLNPGQRFFTLDYVRDASYDYTRPGLADWALPNLACLWGVEDLGGYEPAQSERYREFMRRLHQEQPWRQTAPQHFGLVGVASAAAAFDEANVRAAILPRWGVPLYLMPTREPGILATGYPRGLTQNFQVRVLLRDADTSERLQFQVAQGDNVFRYPLAPPHPLGPADDLAAVPGVFDGSRPAPPLAGHLDAAEGDLPPQFGEPPVLLLGAPLRGRLIDGFYWNPDLAALWRPMLMSEIATLMHYQGAPAWVAWASGTGEVLTKVIEPNRIELTVDVKSAGQGSATARCVVHDAWWPGWQAWVDGKLTDIQPQGLWRALDLSPGRHAIVMAYQPASIKKSLQLCTAGAGVLLLISLLKGVRNRYARKLRRRKA